MEENKNQTTEKVTVTETIEKEIEEKKPFDKKNLIVYAAIGVALALVITVVILLAGGGNDNPEITTPLESTPVESTSETTAQTTPQQTTPAGPTETVTYPSDEDDDPKQEDVFFD